MSSDGIDASERMIDDWSRRVQEQAQRYQAMAARVQEITVTERSRDNLVEVTIDSKGLLTGLVLDEGAQGKRMAELSAQIMRTVQAAQARIPELLQEAMAETVGTEDETAAQIFSEASKTFPDPPETDDDPPSSADRNELHFGPEEDDVAEPPGDRRAPDPPPERERRRRRDPDDDDDDFGGRSIFS